MYVLSYTWYTVWYTMAVSQISIQGSNHLFYNNLYIFFPSLLLCLVSKSDITVIKLKASEEKKNTALQKVVKFLDKMAAQDQKKARRHRLANKVDLICFCIYLTVLIVYAVVILYFSFGSRCEINQLDFWS